MSDIMHILRAVIRDELKALRLGDIAVVTSTMPHQDGDAHNFECSVKLRELDLELRNVPMATPHIGMASAPRVGDLVYISYVGGDPNRPIVVGRLYSDKASPPIHTEDAWHVESTLGSGTSMTLDKDGAVVIKAGDNVVTIKKSDLIEIQAAADLKIEVKGNVELKCTDCKIDASGNIDLGTSGAGVITTQSHKCYFTGAPLVGSQTVKAKG